MPGGIAFEIADFATDLHIGNETAAFHQIFNQAVHFRDGIGMDFSHDFSPRFVICCRKAQPAVADSLSLGLVYISVL